MVRIQLSLKSQVLSSCTHLVEISAVMVKINQEKIENTT